MSHLLTDAFQVLLMAIVAYVAIRMILDELHERRRRREHRQRIQSRTAWPR